MASCAARLGARLGVPTSAAELAASLNPAEYLYPAELSAGKLAELLRSLGPTAHRLQSSAGLSSPMRPLQAGAPAAAPPASPAAADDETPSCPLDGPLEDPYHGSSHLALELDDDCLKLLLGEDEDESPELSAAAPSQLGAPPAGPLTRAAKASAPTASRSANGSEKSSACHEEPTAPAAGNTCEAASHQLERQEEEDDIAMLFDHARHGTSLEPMELHLLGTAPLGAADDCCDSASHVASASDAAILEAAADAGAGLKRARAGHCDAGVTPASGSASPCPSGRGLMLCMNYEKAAESINLELADLAGRSKAPCSDGFEALLFGPLLDLAPAQLHELSAPQLDTPESPDSLASGSDCAGVPPPSLMLACTDSGMKRKRAVAAAQ